MDPTQSSNSTPATIHYQDNIPEPLVIAVAVIMPLVAIIGTLGNTLVIAAVSAHKKLRSVHNVFVVNLAIADLFVISLVIPFAVVGALDKGSFLQQHDSLCEIIGFLVVSCCGASLYSIAFIALERYIFICHQTNHVKMYNRITMPLMVVLIWVVGFLVDLVNFIHVIGWSRHEFNPEILACCFSYRDADIRYILVVCAVPGLAFPIIGICYVLIYRFVRQQSFTGNASVNPADKRLLKVIGTIFVVFVIMWTPFTVSFGLYFYIPVPFWIHFIAGHMCLSNSSVNFLIYAFNEDFRDGYKVVCKMIIRWKYFVRVRTSNRATEDDTYLLNGHCNIFLLIAEGASSFFLQIYEVHKYVHHLMS
ncbi:melatonin receptor type 1B-A-like [Amphiura filiformis]|uniref:melatonin receptor type 1B-A-like n=1 Tax=Amphiura filiformis TaxID=82378 RepID=UPI003B2246FE